MRAACLARNLLVVDEVHASDAYMRRIIKSLLDAHLDARAVTLCSCRPPWGRRRGANGCPPDAGRFNPDDAPPLDEAVERSLSGSQRPGWRVERVSGGRRGERAGQVRVRISAEPVMQRL